MFMHEGVLYEGPLVRLTIRDTSHLTDAEIDRLVKLLQREAVGRVQRDQTSDVSRAIIAYYSNEQEAHDAELDVIMRLPCIVEIGPEGL